MTLALLQILVFQELDFENWDRDANLTLNTRRLKSLVQDTIPAMNSACHVH